MEAESTRGKKGMKPVEKLFGILCLAAAASVGIYYILVMSNRVEYQPPTQEQKGIELLLGDKKLIYSHVFPSRHQGARTKGSGTGNIKNPRKNKFGYLLAQKYYEQQTQATKNFLQLQCLADSYGMRVVEPFIHLSSISFPFSEMISDGKVPLRYGDLINMESWNNQTLEKYGYASVARWEEFLNDAPRSVVIVCLKYRDPPRIHVPIPGQSYRQGCKETCYNKFNSSLAFLERHGFRLVRKVCANFAGFAGTVIDKSFKKYILASFKPDQVTVLFNEFRGFFGLYRMQVVSPCGIKHSSVNISVAPSPRLVKEAHNYIIKNFKGLPYTSILVRIERLMLHNHRNVIQCAEEVLMILKRLKHKYKLEEHFLAMDVGRFGSRGSIIHNFQKVGQDFFRYIYTTKWSFEDWENSFSNSASSLNAAYIANFQRTVAAKGDCLILVGAGGFQAQAKDLYDRYHAPGERCVYQVCSEAVAAGIT